MAQYVSIDGNTAAAYVGYAFSDVVYMYPITPASSMCEVADEWSNAGTKNIFGNVVPVPQMQSEGGVSGAVHGGIIGGQLVSTFSSAQGLLLMIPEMYKLGGELQPGVIHVSTRSVSGQGMTIYSDHSDAMACRQTGWAFMNSCSCQEVLDLGAICHLTTVKASIPFLHFFDGFRVSHEQMKVHQLSYEQLASIYDYQALADWRASPAVMSNERPTMRGLVQNGDVYYQLQEARNPLYDRLPALVQQVMDQYAALSGRQYHLFDYMGAEDAEEIIIMMGAGAPPAWECVEHLCGLGQKVGLIKVRLYRPFSGSHLAAAIPRTCRKITVLDRTKEAGSIGEPLYLDVVAAIDQFLPDRHFNIFRGRYGLGGRDFTPAHCLALFENMRAENGKRVFTIGLNDDLSNLALIPRTPLEIAKPGFSQCVFWGFGADGTVGSCKNAIHIIGEHTDLYSQAYFVYDAKKSGGVTISHLRFGPAPITSQYEITAADYIGCHHHSYPDKYEMLANAKNGAIFVLNTPHPLSELDHVLPPKLRSDIAKKNIQFYIIDANRIATDVGLRGRINMIMQVVFFKLANVIPVDDAINYLKEAIQKTYGKKGEDVVQQNFRCVDASLANLVRVEYDRAAWLAAEQDIRPEAPHSDPFMQSVGVTCGKLLGQDLPTSVLAPYRGGVMPTATARYEKRAVAMKIPVWDADKCIECNLCSLSCAHAAIRPFVLTHEEASHAPAENFKTKPLTGVRREIQSQYVFRIQVAPEDCLGCYACSVVCPRQALTMTDATTPNLMATERDRWSYCVALPNRGELFPPRNVRDTQFQQPMLEFSGACAGCCETQVVKLITQLFGERMYIANSCGCSMVWGGTSVTCPYTVNQEGVGPVYTGTLFEDTAEVGFGLASAVMGRRDDLRRSVRALLASEVQIPENIRHLLVEWNDNYSDPAVTKRVSDQLRRLLAPASAREDPILAKVFANRDLLTRKSFWTFGGDGWAYDIGFGGLDHVLSLGADINILVMDTEVYSNTGGQKSKATPRGAVARFAAGGKREGKKDLGFYAITLGNVYVASCAMGANKQQMLRALQEAESFRGTSLVIVYCPCISHGVKQGMGAANEEQKLAVECGYWNLYRYDPRRIASGENPLQIDAELRPQNFEEKLDQFLAQEVRFSNIAQMKERLMADLEERHSRLFRLFKSFKVHV